MGRHRESSSPSAWSWLLLCALWTSCGGEATPPRHVLLVTLDTTRADSLGCYGSPTASTPVIDGLASRGVLFERCQATAPTTLPSHASLLTGLYPYRHGARNNGTHVLPADVTTLAERLSAQGFVTGAAVSARVLDGTFGLGQGFAHYDDSLAAAVPRDGYTPDDVPAGDTVERALAWLARQDGRRPLFLWLHLFDPHQPLVPPEPYRSAHADAYDGEIAYADAELGRLLAGLASRGLADDTLVVVTADHGESRGEHGEPTHGLFVYEATQHVPLVLSHASLPAGRRLDAVTSGVDVVPTVLQLLGLPAAPDLHGRSLVPLLEGADDWTDDRAVYADTLYPLYAYGWSELAALVDRRGRYIRAPRPEWYDHAVDPRETADRAASAPAELAASARRLDALLRDGERGRDDGAGAALDDALRDSLAALGYTTSARPPLPAAARRDPKDGLADLTLADQAGELVAKGRFAQALPLLDQVASALPDAPEVASLRAQALIGLGRDDEALALLRERVAGSTPLLADILRLAELEHAVDPQRAAAWLALFAARAPRSPLAAIQEGVWALEAGDLAAARQAYERALSLDPSSVPAWLGKGRALAAAGDDSGALSAFRQALLADGSDGEARLALGWQALRMGRLVDAAEALRLACELLPDNGSARAALGVAQQQLGQLTEAEASYRRALVLTPEDWNTSANLARLLLDDGRTDEALELGRRCCAAGATATDGCLVAVIALRRGGALVEAGALLAALRAARPQWLAALVEEAVWHAAAGRLDAAQTSLTQALKRQPTRVRQMAASDPALAALLAARGD